MGLLFNGEGLTESTIIGDHCSALASLPDRVPQGSILGLILFPFYLFPYGSVRTKHNLSFQFYADDTQF